MRGWRNWQTRTAQDRVTERSYGFNSLPAHIFRLSLKSDGLFIWAREAGQQFVPRRDWKNGLERQDKKEIFRLYKEIDIYRRPKGEERPERHMGHPFSPF